MKEQKIGLGDLVSSDTDAVQGIVKGGSLDGSRLVLDTRTGDEGYGDLWPTVAREDCQLIEKGYGQKRQKLWQ